MIDYHQPFTTTPAQPGYAVVDIINRRFADLSDDWIDTARPEDLMCARPVIAWITGVDKEGYPETKPIYIDDFPGIAADYESDNTLGIMCPGDRVDTEGWVYAARDLIRERRKEQIARATAGNNGPTA
jgi:hypothetical protein